MHFSYAGLQVALITRFMSYWHWIAECCFFQRIFRKMSDFQELIASRGWCWFQSWRPADNAKETSIQWLNHCASLSFPCATECTTGTLTFAWNLTILAFLVPWDITLHRWGSLSNSDCGFEVPGNSFATKTSQDVCKSCVIYGFSASWWHCFTKHFRHFPTVQ